MRKIIIAFGLYVSTSSMGFGWIVEDPANLAQNWAHFSKMYEEFSEVERRFNFTKNSTTRFIRRLKGYKFTNIKALYRDIKSFRNRARSIGYNYKSIVKQFEKIYGKHGDFEKKYAVWEKQSDNSIKEAMENQGLVERSDGQMKDLEQAIKTKSHSESEGETLQALAEINAVQAKQINDLKQIIATDARARHSVIMEQRAKQKAQKDYEAHLMKDFNVHQNSKPLAYMPSLGQTAPTVIR